MQISGAFILSLVATVSAHAVMLQAVGDAGGRSVGFGVKDDVSRTATGRDAQTDTSIIRKADEQAGTAGPCGRTKAGGPNDLGAELSKATASKASIARVKAGGQITMTAHVVNADGRGPFNCQASDDDGKTWQDMEVVTNVPGGRPRATDFPLVARFPASMTGNAEGIATVRCKNEARAGPFGGCVAAAIVA